MADRFQIGIHDHFAWNQSIIRPFFKWDPIIPESRIPTGVSRIHATSQPGILVEYACFCLDSEKNPQLFILELEGICTTLPRLAIFTCHFQKFHPNSQFSVTNILAFTISCNPSCHISAMFLNYPCHLVMFNIMLAQPFRLFSCSFQIL